MSFKEEICDFDNLYAAFLEVARGKRYKTEFQEFNFNLEENLINMQNHLLYQTYIPGGTVSFKIREPKLREITRPEIFDRIIHHALIRVVLPVFEKRFHHSSFACRAGKELVKATMIYPNESSFTVYFSSNKNAKYRYPVGLPFYKVKAHVKDECKKLFPDAASYRIQLIQGYGQLSACRRYQEILRSSFGRYGKSFVVLAIDIKSYFQSIDHEILKKMIDRLFPDDAFVRWLFHVIIDAVDEGLPIGFLPSQHEANLIGTYIDYFATDILRCRSYIRYMDDIRITCRTREEAKEILSAIDELCTEKLHLRLSEKKSRIYTFKRYDIFCGYKVFPHHLEAKEATVKRGHKRLRKKLDHYYRGLITKEELYCSSLSLLAYKMHTSDPVDKVAEECIKICTSQKVINRE